MPKLPFAGAVDRHEAVPDDELLMIITVVDGRDCVVLGETPEELGRTALALAAG